MKICGAILFVTEAIRCAVGRRQLWSRVGYKTYKQRRALPKRQQRCLWLCGAEVDTVDLKSAAQLGS